MERGTLFKRIKATSEHALRTGALLRFPTTYTFVEEGGVGYFVRVLEALERKDEARREQDEASSSGKKRDPFLPPESDLTVCDVTAEHVAVLNKYNVLDDHLLIVTRQFEDQDMLLKKSDFEALWLCMSEYDSLGFYNGGRDAGASQQHKHLQLVPLPLAPEGPLVPIAPLLEQAPEGARFTRVPAFPFLHSFVWLEKGIAGSPADAAHRTFGLYGAMLKQVGMTPPLNGRSVPHSQPYCLLMTREWMLLVPRSREFFEDVSLNSLAFAGSFFVRNAGQLERLRAHGMMNALKAVALRA